MSAKASGGGGLMAKIASYIQGSSQKGFGRCLLSCLCAEG